MSLPELTWSVNPVVWQAPGRAVLWFTVFWLGELVVGYRLLAAQVRRGGGNSEDASDLAVYLWIGLFGGARFGELVFYSLPRLESDPLSAMFDLSRGGMSGHGAVVGCALAAWLYAQRRALPPLDVTDRLTLPFGVAAIVHRLGTLFNSDLVGIPTDGSWGVRFPYWDRGLPVPLRHPSQLYEAMLGAVVLGAVWLLDRRWQGEERPRGALTGFMLLGYFGGRLVLDYWRVPLGDPDSPFDTSQWLSLPFIAVGIVILLRSLRQREPAGFRMLEETPEGAS